MTEQLTQVREKQTDRIIRERAEREAWIAKLPSALELERRGMSKRRLRWRIEGIRGQYEFVRPVGIAWAKRLLRTGEVIAKSGTVPSLFKRVG